MIYFYIPFNINLLIPFLYKFLYKQDKKHESRRHNSNNQRTLSEKEYLRGEVLF